MTKVLNTFFSILKYLLFIAAFGSCLYIMLNMNQRLSKSMLDSISVFVPYLLLLIMFVVNLVGNQDAVNKNLFFNLTCCLVLSLIVFVGYRAIADDYMLARALFSQHINFNYYADMISPLKVMLYGLTLADVFLLLSHEKPIAVKMAPSNGRVNENHWEKYYQPSKAKNRKRR